MGVRMLTYCDNEQKSGYNKPYDTIAHPAPADAVTDFMQKQKMRDAIPCS